MKTPYVLDNEQEILDKSLQRLEGLIEENIKTASRVGDLRVIKELIDSQTELVLKQAKIRQSAKVDEDNAKVREQAVSILQETLKNRRAIENRTTTLPEELVPVDILPEETVSDHIELQVSDYIKED